MAWDAHIFFDEKRGNLSNSKTTVNICLLRQSSRSFNNHRIPIEDISCQNIISSDFDTLDGRHRFGRRRTSKVQVSSEHAKESK
jgi:hypothetical protein